MKKTTKKTIQKQVTPLRDEEAGLFIDSITFARQIISNLVSNCAIILVENKFKRRIPEYSYNLSVGSAQAIVEQHLMEFNEFQKKETFPDLDSEPKACCIDTFQNYEVGIVYREIERISSVETTSFVQSEQRKINVRLGTSTSQQYRKPFTKNQVVSQPIQLNALVEKQELDSQDQIQRLLHEEKRDKQLKLLKMQEDIENEQILKKKQMKQISRKIQNGFTYDYNGNLILLKQSQKSFPQQIQQINFNFAEQSLKGQEDQSVEEQPVHLVSKQHKMTKKKVGTSDVSLLSKNERDSLASSKPKDDSTEKHGNQFAALSKEEKLKMLSQETIRLTKNQYFELYHLVQKQNNQDKEQIFNRFKNINETQNPSQIEKRIRMQSVNEKSREQLPSQRQTRNRSNVSQGSIHFTLDYDPSNLILKPEVAQELLAQKLRSPSNKSKDSNRKHKSKSNHIIKDQIIFPAKKTGSELDSIAPNLQPHEDVTLPPIFSQFQKTLNGYHLSTFRNIRTRIIEQKKIEITSRQKSQSFKKSIQS